MGGKKKAPAKKAAADDAEDESVPKFWKQYKKNCDAYGVDKSKCIKELMAKFDEDEEKPKKFHIWDEFGWIGVKCITDALTHVAYPHCQSIRMWKTYCEDEGVRHIVDFM